MAEVDIDQHLAKKTPPPQPHPLDEKSSHEKEEEKVLKGFSFYHGFLPREDLLFLLKVEGDYLLRVSEVGGGEKTLDAEITSRRAIVLSVLTELTPGDTTTASVMGPPNAHVKLKNVIIRRRAGSNNSSKYYVEANKSFDTLKELLDHYQKNPGYLNKAKFMLKNPIAHQRWEFMHSEVQVGKLIGEGAYGEVREGVIKKRNQSLEVAIKLTKGTGELSKAKIKEMMREARLVRNFKHKNIVRLYGVAVDEQPLYILLELVKGGALNTYLRLNSEKVNAAERMSMCRGAAHGVEYLHNQSCIHMDLAARNCLYSEDKIVKISDFGLSRLGLHYTIRTARKLPIKWLAPETITTFTFSLKTDVFTFGVMVFEIFASGCEPWDGFTNSEVKKGLVEGKFLKMPDLCPESFRTFIRDHIFVKDPNARATMSEVCAFLKKSSFESVASEKTHTEKEECEKSVFERLVSESPPKPKPSEDTKAKDSQVTDKKRFKRSKGFYHKSGSKRK